jgi:hypothetical protein
MHLMRLGLISSSTQFITYNQYCVTVRYMFAAPWMMGSETNTENIYVCAKENDGCLRIVATSGQCKKCRWQSSGLTENTSDPALSQYILL